MTTELQAPQLTNLSEFEMEYSQLYTDMARMALGGAASVISAGIFHPCDTIRVRMQSQKPLSDGTLKYRNPLQGMYQIAAEEGLGRAGLMKGIQGTTTLQLSYSMMRYGSYEPIKRMLGEDDCASTPIWKKVVAGGCAGFLASGFSNPFDLLKTRMQAQPAGISENFFWHAKDIYRNHGGFQGYYKGVRITMSRAVILNSTYLSSYDEIKHTIMRYLKLQDGLML